MARSVDEKLFLECENEPSRAKFFKSRKDLAHYTKEKNVIFPKRGLPKGSPLRTPLKETFWYLECYYATMTS
ncbi:hypothetical protein F66182_2628 [Fusarium sp. NRRL 66182]|nr:hypothetical protein F66182_2628 [Fusarium sp. NRRL 66182]